MIRSRLALILAIAGVASLAGGATQALAATDVDLDANPFGSELEIEDMTNDDDAITVSISGSTITIVDTGTNGITTTDLDCTAVNPQTVTCPLDPPDPAPPLAPTAPVDEVELEMGNGTDSFANQNFDVEVEEDDGGTTGNKTVNSGPGDDQIETGDGNDVVNLGPGEDEAETGLGDDTLRGEGGEDDLRPEDGNDVADGGPGTDDIDDESVPNGADLLDGGPGFDDEIEYDTDDPTSITINGVADDGLAGEGDNLAGFEQLNGGEGPDRIVGTAGDDDIEGGDGNDLIEGGAGDDFIDPEEGDDTADGGPGDDAFEGSSFSDESGADVLAGGAGTGDLIEYDGDREGVSVTFNGVADDGMPGERDNLSGIEGAEGTEKADRLVGDASSNVFFGFAGNDTITGGGGNDGLLGGEGDDTLLATGGRDQVECGLGFDSTVHDADDVLEGGCERRGAEVVSDSATAGKKGKAKVKVSCPAEEGATCKGKLVLLSNGKQIGSAKFSVAKGKSKSATVRLTRKGRKTLAKSGDSLRVSAQAQTKEPQGTSVNASPLALEAKAKKG